VLSFRNSEAIRRVRNSERTVWLTKAHKLRSSSFPVLPRKSLPKPHVRLIAGLVPAPQICWLP
jgi:hypothetical protein